MRLKATDGPLAVHNGNNDLLNSPKRINTLQNSNVSNYVNYNTSSLTVNSNDVNNITKRRQLRIENVADLQGLNNVNNDTQELRWCNSDLNTGQQNQQHQRQLALNNLANNRYNQIRNINSTLATHLRIRASPAQFQEPPSPDDALLDDYDAHQSCSSSTSASPQDEDRAFDPSDTGESSDEGNDEILSSNEHTPSLRCIVNPNYPGFQHLAHTLVDGYDEEALTKKLEEDANNANNNNDDDDFKVDKFDSVNRLDSVENIQKVFHDKSLLDIEVDSESLNSVACDSVSDSGGATSDEQCETVNFNIKLDEKVLESVVGDFRKELEDELDRVGLTDEKTTEVDNSSVIESTVQTTAEDSHITDIHPPHCAQNDELSAEKSNLETTSPSDETLTSSPIETKMTDALLSNAQETIPRVSENFENADMNVKKLKMDLCHVDEGYSNKELEALQKQIKKIKSDTQETLPHHVENTDVKIKKSKIKENVGYSNKELDALQNQIKKIKSDTVTCEEVEKYKKEDITKNFKEKEEDCSVAKKREKLVSANCVRRKVNYSQQFGSLITFPRREPVRRDPIVRRSVPMVRDKKRVANCEALGGFDVYNIETAMPKIDLEAIENHLRAAREEERRRRTDREEIRRRLAMGSEDEYYMDRPGRKPSLQARLQSGMNLQICFMNETVSDNESPNSDTECPMTNPKQPKTSSLSPSCASPNANGVEAPVIQRPATLSLHPQPPMTALQPGGAASETDFFTKQARLQTEARMALAQAKEMARMQMEIERQRQKKSPITEMVRHSLEKVGIPFPEEKRRLSRQILTEMNVAQLQVIVNDLHTQIEILNEQLVKYLMDRDDLHMEQDSMLVDIEDLTRYLGAKEQVLKDQCLAPTPQNNNLPPPSPAPSSPLAALNSTVKPHLHRIASLVKK